MTVAARCALGSRSAEGLAQAVRACYAYSSLSRRLRCVRAYVGLPGGDVGVLAFFEGRRVLATAPTEPLARRLLDECPCSSPEDGSVSNVFACGAVGFPLELEALRGRGFPARFDGPRARSVLRLEFGSVQLDAFQTGRYTAKGPSEEAVGAASVSFRALLDSVEVTGSSRRKP